MAQNKINSLDACQQISKSLVEKFGKFQINEESTDEQNRISIGEYYWASTSCYQGDVSPQEGCQVAQ